MEVNLSNIFKGLEEAVEQIKQSGFRDVEATNNVIQRAQNLLANIKNLGTEKEEVNSTSRKRKLDATAPTNEDEPQAKKAKLDLAVVPYAPRSAYAIFLAEKREEIKAADPAYTSNILNRVVSPALAQRRQIWTNMSPEERGVYNQKQLQDRERYEREAAEYIAKGGKMVLRTPRVADVDGSDSDSDGEEGPKREKAPKFTRRAPGAPKRPKSAYMAWTFSARLNYPSTMPFAEKARLLSEQWQRFSDEEKQPFVQKAALDKERYERELKEFQENNSAPIKVEKKTGRQHKKGEKDEPESEQESDSSSSDSEKEEADTVEAADEDSPAPRTRAKRDPNMPKRPMSAYLLWVREVRPTMAPELSITQQLRMCGERWKNMSQEEKQPWTQQAALEKERYARDLLAYEQAQNTAETNAARPRKTRVKKMDSDDEDDGGMPIKKEVVEEEEDYEKPTRRTARRSAMRKKK